ncbi:MAG: hypothetical protein ACO3A4_03440 [Silvanigrellaceae bacterium]
MPAKIRFHLVFALAMAYFLTSGCKKNSSNEWTDSDLQAISASINPESPPPQNILARLLMDEREIALMFVNAWAGRVNATEGKNPNSVLNQVRRLFNPDHMKKISFQEAISRTRTEGSGTHGSAKSERRPQDSLYHALWSRIADTAGIAGFPRSSKHMKHYLANSGQPIRYSFPEVESILQQSEKRRQPERSPIEDQFFSEFMKKKLQLSGLELSNSELSMITRMSQRELPSYIARLRVFIMLAQFTQKNGIKSATQLQVKLEQLKSKNFPAKSADGDGAWVQYRPIGKYYSLEHSEPHSDLFFALGSFAGIHSATPIDVRAEGETLKIRFAQTTSIYDKYNWDEGKFVTLWSGWCWKMNSDNCFQIESLTSLTVSDRSIGRLHKLGMAHEFEIFGKGPMSTVWDSINFRDLTNPQKQKVWDALGKALDESLTPLSEIPD